MKKMNRYQQFKARALRSPRARKAYEEGLEDLRVAVSLAELREQRGMTQTQLAAKSDHPAYFATGAGPQCGVQDAEEGGRSAGGSA